MKKKVQFLLKFVVSFALIWYLLSQTQFSAVYESLTSADPWWLLCAFVTLYIGKVLTGYRWQVLLAAQGIKIPLLNLIASIFVGQFFNSFLPTTVGGDAMRAYDTAVHSKEAAKSVTSVFADRLIGVLALALLAIVGIAGAFFVGEDVTFYLWPVLAVFLVCFVGFVLVFNRTLAAALEAGLRRFGLAKIADKVNKAYLSLHILRDNPLILPIAFGISLALQINVVLFYFFISLALSLGVSLLYFFIIIPVALVVLLVPFSINGIGLREGIFVFLMGRLGVATQDAIAFSWIALGLILTQGVIGGVIFAFRGLNLKRQNINRTALSQQEKTADI